MTAARQRFGIDATPLLGRRSGIGRVVAELIDRMTLRLRDDEELVLSARVTRQNPLFGVSHAPLLERAARPRVRLVRHLMPFSVAERIGRALPWAPVDFAAGRLDTFHGPNFFLPATRARGLVTIHDLAFLRHPEHVPAEFRERFERISRDAAFRAEFVIADSDATARDVVELLGAPAEHVVTIHPGVSDAFVAPRDRDADRVRVRAAHGIDLPYVLFAGTTHPRKNLLRLLDAFAAARATARLPHLLVLVGDVGFGDASVRERIAASGLTGAVLLPGYVAEDDLPALFSAADALAFPSLYEGFGLPVVEAFGTGTPVLTSRVSSLPEVAGDGALLVDPASTDAIAGGLVRLLTDAELRARLVAAGRARLPLFSWDAAAERHLALYRELAARDADGPRT